jgi:nucleoside-diphosphate-sugar epimerase
MAERVLVTGATGFVAGHCVEELLAHGYAVRGTVRDPGNEEKVAHLRALGGDLELVAADLDADDGWAAAVAGCSYVLHVASPFPYGTPDHEDDLIRPAVQGTLRVLRACAADSGVRRVVLTSSLAAIVEGHDKRDRTVRTEDDWSVVEASPAYQKSKTLAERAAWDYARTHGDFELVALNPGMVLGPLQRASAGTSVQPVQQLLARKVPASPRVGFATVDVRDLAVAHRLAMESSVAAGRRYILAGNHSWLRDMAKTLAEEFPANRVPTGALPDWLVWTLARFDRSMRMVWDFVGRENLVSAERATRELGWTMRPLRETLRDTGESLVKLGMVT